VSLKYHTTVLQQYISAAAITGNIMK